MQNDLNTLTSKKLLRQKHQISRLRSLNLPFGSTTVFAAAQKCKVLNYFQLHFVTWGKEKLKSAFTVCQQIVLQTPRLEIPSLIMIPSCSWEKKCNNVPHSRFLGSHLASTSTCTDQTLPVFWVRPCLIDLAFSSWWLHTARLGLHSGFAPNEVAQPEPRGKREMCRNVFSNTASVCLQPLSITTYTRKAPGRACLTTGTFYWMYKNVHTGDPRLHACRTP